MDCGKLICSEKSSIKEAMTCIDRNSKGIVFVIDAEQRLVGVATDGDIRRALLNGIGLGESIKVCMNEHFIYAYNPVDAQRIFQQCDGEFKIIPLVNEDMHVIDYVECSNKQHIALTQPQLNGNEYNYLIDAFLSTWISSTGKYITQFEKNFAEYCGVQYGIATSNGTTALHLALTALGVGDGDEVIIPDITFAATINAVIYTGARPVIVDINEESWEIDPHEIERAITPQTRAIIPVHLYGQPCDMGKICDIAQRNGLYIVEDCAEAHGAEWNHKKVGAFGIISCFSFFGNKVITTGEGGMCLTDSKELNDKMRILRDHGMSKEKKYYHEVIGFNYRMTNMQAAIGVAQLEHIDQILEWRFKIEEMYRCAFKKIPGIQMQRNNLPDRKKIAWLVSVLVNEEVRDVVIEELKKHNIDARPFFVPLSEMAIYRQYARVCVKSKKLSRRGVNLPTMYEMDEEKIEKIVSIMKTVC